MVRLLGENRLCVRGQINQIQTTLELDLRGVYMLHDYKSLGENGNNDYILGSGDMYTIRTIKRLN